MSEFISIDQLHRLTVLRLREIVSALSTLLEQPCSDRVRLLTGAFLPQMSELLVTVQKIGQRQSARALRRKVAMPTLPAAPEALQGEVDSMTLTFWLLDELNAEARIYGALEEAGRLGAARGCVAELAALFVAQSKRIALEAHRFSDL